MSREPDDITAEGVNLTKLRAPFPDSALKSRPIPGGKSMTYVSVDTVIRRLNASSPTWDWKVTRVEWRDETKGSLCIVYGELTLPGMGTRTGVGVQKVAENGGEDLVKGASGDGLKKASTLFGVGLELYGEDKEAEEELLAAKTAFAEAVHKFYGDSVLDKGGHFDGVKMDSVFGRVTGKKASDATVDDFCAAIHLWPAYVEKQKAEKAAKQKQNGQAAPAQSMTDALAADADAGKPATAASNYATMETQEGRR